MCVCVCVNIFERGRYIGGLEIRSSNRKLPGQAVSYFASIFEACNECARHSEHPRAVVLKTHGFARSKYFSNRIHSFLQSGKETKFELRTDLSRGVVSKTYSFEHTTRFSDHDFRSI